MKYFKICPRCGSVDIVPSMTTGILPDSNYCNDCNYKAGIFPEVKESEIEKVRKDFSQVNKNLPLTQLLPQS